MMNSLTAQNSTEELHHLDVILRVEVKPHILGFLHRPGGALTSLLRQVCHGICSRAVTRAAVSKHWAGCFCSLESWLVGVEFLHGPVRLCSTGQWQVVESNTHRDEGLLFSSDIVVTIRIRKLVVINGSSSGFCCKTVGRLTILTETDHRGVSCILNRLRMCIKYLAGIIPVVISITVRPVVVLVRIFTISKGLFKGLTLGSVAQTSDVVDHCNSIRIGLVVVAIFKTIIDDRFTWDLICDVQVHFREECGSPSNVAVNVKGLFHSFDNVCNYVC
mmetsp:Transcript_46481/g.92076  ORF Transcript_46481/g.92076 Transcript_46481/m.92076 type:complete len:275 (+) Transcript_46481:274-1098(+)